MDVPNPLIIVGGGLAGLCAAHQAIQLGSNIILIEKQSYLGGNSIRASTGINAVTLPQDSPELFKQDMLQYGKISSPNSVSKIHTLAYNSKEAIDWLTTKFDLKFIQSHSCMTGNSVNRTLTFAHGKPGHVLVRKLTQALEELCLNNPNNFKIMLNTQMTDFIKSEKEGDIVGIKCNTSNNLKQIDLKGPIIITTGGYNLHPSMYTVGGLQASGDAHRIVGKHLGVLTNSKKFQLRPIGLHSLNQLNTENRSRKLLLTMEDIIDGSILLNSQNERFCIEDSRNSDKILHEMINKYPLNDIYTIMINQTSGFKSLDELTTMGYLQKLPISKLHKYLKIPSNQLTNIFKSYNIHNQIKFQDSQDNSNWVYVGKFSPGIFISLGGIQTNDELRIKSLKGLVFAAGEAVGDIFGDALITGSSLLSCVVFGRMAAMNACKILLSKLSNNLHNNNINNTNNESLTQTSKPRFIRPQLRLKQIETHLSPPPPFPEPRDPRLDPSEVMNLTIPQTEFTMTEVAKHNTLKDCWIVVKNVVIDCSKFLAQHPGGLAPIANLAGQDATAAFESMHDDLTILEFGSLAVIGRVKDKTPYLEFDSEHEWS